MSKLEMNKNRKRTSLLDTAFHLFTTKGINKTTISDIVDNAGVAKGTFYLYFTDKYDIRNKLISHKSSELFKKANDALQETNLTNFKDKLIFIVDHIIDQLVNNQSLLNFISKNLSWGIFKKALISPALDDDINFYDVYLEMLSEEAISFSQPELMLFMIVELVSSTCYSTILYNEPVSIDQLKPELYKMISTIIETYTN